MMNVKPAIVAVMLLCMVPFHANAELAAGHDTFLGNIYSKGQTPANFDLYWNQVTPANAGKWASCEQQRDVLEYWTWMDRAYNYAQANGFPFKEHCLIWGHSSGEPGWVCGLSPTEQKAEVIEWIEAICERYPDMDYIDVVNEPLHAPPCYKDAIGGDGETGWDWVIWSYEQARGNSDAKLLINDYGILNSAVKTTAYIALINLLKERNLVDGIGVQAHGLEGTPISTIKSNLDALAATGLPIYVSEYEVDRTDPEQATIFNEQFPVFWTHYAVKGVTLWGYIEGDMWRPGAYLVTQDGTERPAIQWLREYLNSDQSTATTSPPPPLPTPNTVFIEVGGQAVMEAENFTNYFPGQGSFAHYEWVKDTSNSNASGGVHILASPNDQKYALADIESPRMGYYIDFSTSGNYHVWVRRTGNGGDDSCQISIDLGAPIQWSYGSSGTFEWSRYSSTFSISKGVHMLKIGMREDGARIDKIVMTTNPSFTPSGQGPAESKISGDPIQHQPPPIEQIIGDTDGNSQITNADAIQTARAYVGLDPAGFTPVTADVDCDGQVTIVDALIIAQYAAGMVDGFCLSH